MTVDYIIEQAMLDARKRNETVSVTIQGINLIISPDASHEYVKKLYAECKQKNIQKQYA